MSKSWDHDRGGRTQWVAWMTAVMSECHRVLKPGGHAVVWAMPRTSHWTAWAIEDAGFDIRDCIVHLFGSGFPKGSRVNRDARFCHCGATGDTSSHTSLALPHDGRIHTEVDEGAVAGVERSAHHVTRTALGSPADYRDGLGSDGELLHPVPEGDLASAPSPAGAPRRNRSAVPVDAPGVGSSHSPLLAPHSGPLSSQGYRLPVAAPSSPGNGTSSHRTPDPQTDSGNDSQASRRPGTAGPLSAWPHCPTCGKPDANGWNVALKPASEHWWLARKPLAGTVAGNVLAHGTGALNIDGCRVAADDGDDTNRVRKTGTTRADGWGWREPTAVGTPPTGRWPANVVLSHADDCGDTICAGGCPVATLDAQTADQRAAKPSLSGSANGDKFGGPLYGTGLTGQGDIDGYDDSGGCSRFFAIFRPDEREANLPVDSPDLPKAFYTAKASTAERVTLYRQPCECEDSWPTTQREAATDGAATLPGSSTSRSGSSITGDPSPLATRSTTWTATRATTTPPTFSQSPLSSTSASTPAANNGMVNGGSPAASAVSSSGSASPTGISVAKAGPSTDGAARATSPRWSSRSVCGSCGAPAQRESHSTVKPLDLMRHLVRLVTPPGGLVCDPFAGSGTTAEAALLEGFRCITIEREPDYLPLIVQRINRRRDPVAATRAAPDGPSLFDLLEGA